MSRPPSGPGPSGLGPGLRARAGPLAPCPGDVPMC